MFSSPYHLLKVDDTNDSSDLFEMMMMIIIIIKLKWGAY